MPIGLEVLEGRTLCSASTPTSAAVTDAATQTLVAVGTDINQIQQHWTADSAKLRTDWTALSNELRQLPKTKANARLQAAVTRDANRLLAVYKAGQATTYQAMGSAIRAVAAPVRTVERLPGNSKAAAHLSAVVTAGHARMVAASDKLLANVDKASAALASDLAALEAANPGAADLSTLGTAIQIDSATLRNHVSTDAAQLAADYTTWGTIVDRA